MGISCDDCTIDEDEETQTTVWEFDTPPRIEYVDPDGPAGKAGLHSGDVLQQIDGMPLTSAKGGKRFGSVRPGESVRWTYARDGKRHEVTLVAAAHPDVDRTPEAVAELEAALAQLRAEEEQLRHRQELLRLEMAARREQQGFDKAMADSLARRAYEDALRQMETTRQALEETYQSLNSQFPGPRAAPPAPAVTPRPPQTPIVPTRHNLRFAGTIGGSQVEVHGSGAVVVTEDAEDEIVITTPDATIRITKRK